MSPQNSKCKRSEILATTTGRRTRKSTNQQQQQKRHHQTRNTMSQIKLTSLVLVLLTLGQPARSSGVFELELVKLEQLMAEHPIAAHSRVTTTDNSTRSGQPEEANNLVRVFVCLKEAFASQLDGPCTFGNASITLNRDSLRHNHHSPAQSQQATTPGEGQESQHRHHEQLQTGKIYSQTSQLLLGSPMTNVVRIIFTFRWTKSFTIILTAEQLSSDAESDGNYHQHQPAQPANGRRTLTQQLVAFRSVGSNGTDLPNLPSAANATNRTLARSLLASAGANLPQPVGSASRYIDRHVLTENEILPNLELNANKPWSSRFSRSLKSSLAYRFRVYCSLNYFGDGCTTFCRPRDDQFGHFNCSSTGQKVCLEGWQGPDCDKAICRAGCNQQHGYCDRPHTCQCRPGWTGSRCDECIAYPGCQNGYCMSPWQCVCNRNWGGVLCDQDLNYCGSHDPCKNNGTCQNFAPGRYKCHCPDGFTGVDCDINLSLMPVIGAIPQLSAGCAMNPCLNGGTCYGFDSLSIGDASLSTGAYDEQAALSMGNTHELNRCQCPPGWVGDYCQWSDNLPSTNLLSANASVSNDSSTPTTTLVNDPTAEPQHLDTIPPFMTVVPQDIQNPYPVPHVDLRHVISGVVIASIIGVFLASILLAWCCLVAMERNRFSFIQMNIIRADDGESGSNQPVVSSTLRRMHEKIRDSLRRSSRVRIKPETKLSIENVLKPPRPPPTYEESSSHQHVNTISIEYACPKSDSAGAKTLSALDSIEQMKGILVIEQAMDCKSAALLPSSSSSSEVGSTHSANGSKDDMHGQGANTLKSAQLACPRHGHLYKQQQVQFNRPRAPHEISERSQKTGDAITRTGRRGGRQYTQIIV